MLLETIFVTMSTIFKSFSSLDYVTILVYNFIKFITERRLSMSFIYSTNKQLKDEYRKLLIDKGLTMTDIATKLDIVPQQLQNKFNNKRIAFSDLSEWLDLVGYELVIDFKPKS